MFSEDAAIHDVATLLKEFFRDLPEPLIPKELLPGLLAIQSKPPSVVNRHPRKPTLFGCFACFTESSANTFLSFVLSSLRYFFLRTLLY